MNPSSLTNLKEPHLLIHASNEFFGRLAARWVASIQVRARLVAAVFATVTAGLAIYAGTHLGVNTSELDLFADDLHFVQLREDYFQAFPNSVEPLVVVVEGETVDRAQGAAQALARALRGEPELFPYVYHPGGGVFFERQGLLYLDTHQLTEVLDNLYTLQPYLARLSDRPSLTTFLELLNDGAGAVTEQGSLGGSITPGAIVPVLEETIATIEGHLTDTPRFFSWAELMQGSGVTADDRREYLMVRPAADFSQLSPAEPSLLRLRDLVAELGLDPTAGVTVRTTGSLALSYEEVEHVTRQVTWAALASFILVAIILFTGLGSWRAVLASLFTLICGLIWTAAFATAAVGSLNVISVFFAVLFIGLSVDLSIHLCLRFRELAVDEPVATAMSGAARSVGGSLVICSLTTGVGFYAFVPTPYGGVSELGLIGGTGMLISVFTNLTLLPALIFCWVKDHHKDHHRVVPGAKPNEFRALQRLLGHSRPVLGASAILAILALTTLPKVWFDTNPLRVRDLSTTSVQVFNEMLTRGEAFVWNLNALEDDLESAQLTAKRLERLAPVERTLTLADYVPQDQEEKLDLIDDAALVILPSLRDQGEDLAGNLRLEESGDSAGDYVQATRELRQTLEQLGEHSDPELKAASFELAEALTKLLEHWHLSQSESGRRQLLDDATRLEGALLESLPSRLRRLSLALSATPVTLDDLPPDLIRQMTATDGRARVEIFPAGNLSDREELAHYVREVQSVALTAFGEGLVILESGNTVVASLKQALLTAALAILALLYLLWRNWLETTLVSAPLVLATLLIAASTVWLGLPFNFANTIVIPLLLGVGVDTGIHLVHRVRGEALNARELLTSSTARAVVLSALTTIASFGTLGFSSHLGMASLGQLLAIGVTLMLLCNLVVLPALLRCARG